MPIFRPSQSDSLLALIALVNADPRPDKIDVGVGVFRDGAGNTPILKVIKEAEQRLLDTQETKAYLGSAGDKRFAELLRPILLGQHAGRRSHRRRADAGRLRRASPRLRADRDGQSRRRACSSARRPGPTIRRSSARSGSRSSRISLLRARAGRDPLRGHDRGAASGASRATSRCSTAAATIRPAPTSSEDQWREVVRVVVRARAASRSIDIAYQGFGRGLDEDAFGVRLMLDACDEVIIAQSCDKNFSVYRDRVGSLFVKTGSREATANGDGACLPASRARCGRCRPIMAPPRCTSSSTIPSFARAGWSSSTRCATASIRFASGSPRPTRGWPLSAGSSACSRCCRCRKEQVLKLREDHAIYMADSGRFNVVGMGDDADRPIYRRRGRARWTR